MVTWRGLITDALHLHHESWADVVACTLTEHDLDREFNNDFGALEGTAFTCWTQRRVYFPACYDGAEWVASVSRHPDGHPTEHVGSG